MIKTDSEFMVKRQNAPLPPPYHPTIPLPIRQSLHAKGRTLMRWYGPEAVLEKLRTCADRAGGYYCNHRFRKGQSGLCLERDIGYGFGWWE